MKYTILIILVFNFCFCQEKLELNKKSPEINITDWIENVPIKKKIKDKYIVLEFWATWCSPCLKSVPHLNELQKKYNQDNLIFISITDEKTSKVKKILEFIQFNSIVVTDTTKATQKKFGDKINGLKALPLTVLIDNNNIVRWIGTPKELNEDVMNSFLENKEIKNINNTSIKTNVIKKTNFENFLEIAKDDNLEYYLEITKSNKFDIKANYQNKVNFSLFYLESVTLKEILTSALNYNQNLFSVDSLTSKNKYNIIYKNKLNNNESSAVLEKSILDIFNVKKTIVKKKIQSNKIYLSDSSSLEKSIESESSITHLKDKVILFHYNLKMLCDYLNNNSVVLFHYNDFDTNCYYNFSINLNNYNSIIKSLELQGIKTNKEYKIFDYYYYYYN